MPKSMPTEVRDQVIELMQDPSLAYTDIAAAMDVSASYVSQLARDLGLSRGTPSRRCKVCGEYVIGSLRRRHAVTHISRPRAVLNDSLTEIILRRFDAGEKVADIAKDMVAQYGLAFKSVDIARTQIYYVLRKNGIRNGHRGTP